MPTTHLLYLHGFRSSPQSSKARLVAEYVRQHHPQVVWLCPQLPPSPAAAMQAGKELAVGLVETRNIRKMRFDGGFVVATELPLIKPLQGEFTGATAR